MFENKQEYYDHVADVATIDGEYVGEKQTIYRTPYERLRWGILHKSDRFGNSVELYETLEEAIEDYIALNPLPQ